MTQKFIIVFAIFLFIPLYASAQNIYNSTGSGGSNIYNSSSRSGAKPLSLRQIIEGRDEETARSSYSDTGDYYGGQNYRPYGVSNNNYSLNLSAAEIEADRARRNREAQRAEREAIDSLQQAAFVPYTETSSPNIYEGDFYSYGSGQSRRRVGSSYKQRDDQNGFEMPRKVFNSIY